MNYTSFTHKTGKRMDLTLVQVNDWGNVISTGNCFFSPP